MALHRRGLLYRPSVSSLRLCDEALGNFLHFSVAGGFGAWPTAEAAGAA
jgi:hypothetical protein